LKVDSLSKEPICAGSEFQVDIMETENAPEEKLVVMADDLCWKNIRLWVKGSG